MNSPSNADVVLAILSQGPEAVNRLLAQGADINGRDPKGFTPLMIAAWHGKKETVALLLSAGAQAGARSLTGTTALMLAADTGHEDVVKMLLSAGALADVGDSNGWTALMMAARKNQTGIVRALLGQGVDIDARNIDGSSAILYAVEEGHTESVRLLLAENADLATPNRWGSTPLGLAADRGFSQIVELLLNAGADVNEANPVNGMTALHFAAQNGCLDVAAQLVARGADPGVSNRDGSTPLMYARARGHTGVAEMLSAETGSRTADMGRAALLSKGMEHSANGELEQALTCFETAAKLDSSDAKLWHNIGLARSALHRTEGAIEAYDRALRLDGSLWQTWNNKGEELRVTGRLAEALQCYDKALQIQPADSKSLYNKGVVLNLMMDSFERHDEARRCFQRAKDLGHPRADEQLRVMDSLMKKAAGSMGVSTTDARRADAASRALEKRHGPEPRSESKDRACPRCQSIMTDPGAVCRNCGHVEWGCLGFFSGFTAILAFLCYQTWFHWSAQIPWSQLASMVRWGAVIVLGIFLLSLSGQLVRVFTRRSGAKTDRAA
ncbi:MAG: ankyrin repeat domain-containing protein [Acidobacteriota bacterium]